MIVNAQFRASCLIHTSRMTLTNAENVTLRNSATEMVQVSGPRSRKIRILDTEGKVTSSAEVAKDAIMRR